MGVLEVGHEAIGAGIQRVDDHLAIDRPGDFDAAVPQIGRQRRDAPVRRRGCASVFRQEVGHLAGVESGLPLAPRGQQHVPAGVELAVQIGDEAQRFGRQDGGVGGRHRPPHFDAVRTCDPCHAR